MWSRGVDDQAVNLGSQIKDNLHAYNLDGREFIHKAISDLDIAMKGGDKWKTFDHFVMNLPATAIEFLGKSWSPQLRLYTLCEDLPNSILYRRLPWCL